MDLKKLTRDKIIHTILRHSHSSHSWRILIIHKTTISILTTLFTKDELIFHDIYNYDLLENTNRKPVPDHPAIYFVYPTKVSIKQIVSDMTNRMYSRYTVFFVEEPQVKVSFEYKVININFICHLQNVFTCELKNLCGIFDVLGHSFNVNYYGQHSVIAENLDRTMGKLRKGELIISDRMYDLITPLVRFYTFEPLLRDFNFCQEFDELNDLWRSIRYEHIRDVNIILSNEAKKLNRDIAKIKDVDTKDLIKMVYEAPEKVHLKQKVSEFLNLLEKAITKFEKENLNFVSLTEQNIILKIDQNGNRYTESVQDFMKICKNEEVTLTDKKKLFFILSIVGYDFQKSEEKELLNLGIIEKEDIIVKNKLMDLRKNNVLMKDSDFKYTISRYKPLLYYILKDFLTKNKLTTSVNKDKSSEITSLRKSEFIYLNNMKNKKIICIYILGGLTYEEIKVATDIAKLFRVDIIIGSDEIIDYDKFISRINTMK